MARFTRQLYYINSRNRLSGTDSDFTYAIDLRNFTPSHCVVLSCNIPKSFFVVQEGQNTLTLTEEDVNTATITIPAGNYNRSNLKSVLQTLLTTNSPNAYTYVISVPNSASSGDTGKYTFSCVGHTLQPKLTFSSDNNLYELLGFDSGSTNSFSAGSLVSSNVVKLTKEDSIFIHSDIVGGISGDILQEIYSVDSPDFSNIIFHNHATDHYEQEMNGTTNNIFRFYLTNEDGIKLELNGLNWSMTLSCYKKDDSSDFLKQYLKYSLSKSP
jgi:hypothetical protein